MNEISSALPKVLELLIFHSSSKQPPKNLRLSSSFFFCVEAIIAQTKSISRIELKINMPLKQPSSRAEGKIVLSPEGK